MTERIVYLAGYSGREPSWLLSAAVRLHATVFDIRYNPRSRRPEWSKAALRRLLGDRYRHVSGFGNRLYQTDDIELADPEAGLALFDETSGPIVLMCICPVSETCHRRTVADLLIAERGVTVHELDAAIQERETRQMALFSQEQT